MNYRTLIFSTRLMWPPLQSLYWNFRRHHCIEYLRSIGSSEMFRGVIHSTQGRKWRFIVWYQNYRILSRLSIFPPAHRAFPLQRHLSSLGHIRAWLLLCSWLIIRTYISLQVPIYTPGWIEAIKSVHFAQECKHGNPAGIRTRDPLINA